MVLHGMLNNDPAIHLGKSLLARLANWRRPITEVSTGDRGAGAPCAVERFPAVQQALGDMMIFAWAGRSGLSHLVAVAVLYGCHGLFGLRCSPGCWG